MHPNHPTHQSGEAPQKKGSLPLTELGALFDFAKGVFTPQLCSIEHDEIKASVLMVPNGSGGVELQSVKDLIDEYRERPERRMGTIEVDDLESFIFLVNRDKNQDSMIFARRDAKRPSLTAVLNFHDAGGDMACFCDDRVQYDFPLSDEWKAWTSKDGKAAAMPQEEFARWLEDHIFDIGEPAAAGTITQAFATKLGVQLAGPQRLMEVSRGLELRVNSAIRNVVNLGTGEAQLVYATEHSDATGAPLNVPAAFHLLIPIFKQGATYSIPVRLRYRAGSGKVSWFYEMHRADLFLLDALDEAIARVRQPEDKAPPPDTKTALTLRASTGGCGLPVVLGTPPN